MERDVQTFLNASDWRESGDWGDRLYAVSGFRMCCDWHWVEELCFWCTSWYLGVVLSV